ncbi:rod-binding protein [Sulfurimonas sp. HSL-1716]|uniref:rod-binding protein n=1 Tax=Hydrocurvibacter sulfurireducens TaxID=3131937 RepID=UPI0031FA2087
MSSSINSAFLQQAMLAKDISSTPKIEATTDNKKLREQTDAFESIIIKMMMDNAMKDEKNLFSSQKDPGDKIYKSMYREELSKASAGSFGFSQMLYDYLSQKSGKIN